MWPEPDGQFSGDGWNEQHDLSVDANANDRNPGLADGEIS